MFPFDSTTHFPKTWRETSFDYKLMFGYHISMMVLFALGELLSALTKVAIAGVILFVLIVLSIHHRWTSGWRWPGVQFSHILSALISLVLGGIFLGSATPLFPPIGATEVPWYLAGAGIMMFWVLLSLRIVTFSEVDFLTPQSTVTAAALQPIEAWWKRIARVLCLGLFLANWLTGQAFFYYFGIYFQDGSPVPTATQTEILQNHGTQVYITVAEKAWLDLLGLSMLPGIPLTIGLVLFMHFVLGVRVFPNMATWQELRERRRSSNMEES